MQYNISLEGWKAWTATVLVAVVGIVLLGLAIGFGVDAHKSPTPIPAIAAVGVPTTGATGAVLQVQDPNPNTVAFAATAYAQDGSGTAVTSSPYKPNTGIRNAAADVFTGEVSFTGLAPNTKYKAIVQSLGTAGTPTNSTPTTVYFQTTGPSILNPITNLQLVDSSANYFSQNPALPGWAVLTVNFDKVDGVTYFMIANSPALTEVSKNNNFQPGGAIFVPGGVPVTVSLTPVKGPVFGQYQNGESLPIQGPAAVQTLNTVPYLGVTPFTGTPGQGVAT